MSNSGVGSKTLAGLLKYGVDYRTIDNSGDVTAKLLDAAGNAVIKSTDIDGNTLNPPSDVYWSASKQMPSHVDRRLFSISGLNGPFEFKGNFSLLPADVQATLNTGPWKANSEATKAAKGSDQPLVDTGQLKQSIRAQVEVPGNPPAVVG